jgi:hypothetical protein
VQGFDGIEVWNQMSDWAERIRSWMSVVRFAYPRRFLLGPPPELLRKWDELNRQRFVAGIGGVDAHTRQLRLGPFRYTVFRLRVELKGIRTHLYLPSSDDSAQEQLTEPVLMDAMRNGHGFVSNYRWGDARGTRIYLRTTEGTVHLPGRADDVLPPEGAVHVELPSEAAVSLVCNGTVVGRYRGRSAVFPVRTPGVYRVEARKRNRPWIYANPFPIGPYPL